MYREDFTPEPEYLVQMPDALRIQQRLGQISMANATQAELTRIIARRAGDKFSPENFVGIITDGIAEHKQNCDENNRIFNEETFTVEKVPKLITRLLSNNRDKRRVLSYWFGEIYKKEYLNNNGAKPVDEDSITEAAAFISENVEKALKPDLPRKMKKARRTLRPEIRPHTNLPRSKRRH